MSQPTPSVLRRRRLLAGGVALLLVGGGAAGVAAAAGAFGGGADAAASAARPTPTATVAPEPIVSDPPAEPAPAPAPPPADPAGSAVAPPLAEVAGLEGASGAVLAQLEYVNANWDATSNAQYGFMGTTNCVNFASQSLIARGWSPDGVWYPDPSGDAWSHSAAWVSSTAFRNWLQTRPELATPLTDAQRDQVKPGDIVQFDWDRSGDRDHTGIVTSVTRLADGTIDIRYAGHTEATWDRSVDYAITVKHPGGEAFYWSIPG